MTEKHEIIVLNKIPRAYFREVEGRKLFSPRRFDDWVRVNYVLVNGHKKTNYDIEIREQDDGFEIVATGLKIDPDVVISSYQDKMDRGKEMARLVQENARPEQSQTIFLPENLRLDPERERAPEVIDGYLYVRDSQEVSKLIEVQKWITKDDLYLDDEVFKKVVDSINPFVVNEYSRKSQLISFMLQKIDYSGSYLELHASVFENGILTKPIKLNIAEELTNSTILQSLMEHLKYPVDERAYFEALADVQTFYDIKSNLVKTKSIKILEIKEDGLARYSI